MCGIFARIYGWSQGKQDNDNFDYNPELINRGPDSTSSISINNILLSGYVLHLRGNLTPQPYGEDSRWLLWNGELYGNNIFGSHNLDLSMNDTQLIFNLLKEFNPVQLFSDLEACFAFIYLTPDELWFGRDFLGRRSLLMHSNESCTTLSSVGPGTQVQTGGIFKLNLHTNECELVPWGYSGLRCPSLIRFENCEIQSLGVFDAIERSVEKRLIGLGQIGVLFSGGLDCSVITGICCKYLDPSTEIFLLNVSFEANSPDRITAISSFKELQSLFPIHKISLILIDIDHEELERHKERIILLLGANDSRMDFSIGAALYFASKGEGSNYTSGDEARFPGKILFSGIGADEIFGGYSRYKSSFKHYGKEGVIREMSLDLDRLWHRNMGRDDRIVSCHSRELRFPYLDTHLWLALSKLDLDLVTQVDKPGLEKHLLREFARKMGFGATAGYKKRAIQFGTRVSQQCNRNDFGSNRKAKGWQSISKDKDCQIQAEIQFCCKELQDKVNLDAENSEKLIEVIGKLQDSKVSINDKRHLMRVYIGDYVSALSSVSNEDD